jgi:hypothetical protein
LESAFSELSSRVLRPLLAEDARDLLLFFVFAMHLLGLTLSP